MSIKISIELSALQDRRVASALARLVELLGPEGEAPAPRAMAPAPGSAPLATPAVAPRAAPAGGGDFAEFMEALPDRSRRFIELVRARGTLTIDDAMSELGITVPKAVGGVTGSIARWAPRSGIAVPYVAVKVRGRRAWRWTGAADAPAVESAPDGIPLPGYADALPRESRRFLEVLYERGELKMGEVLQLFDLPRPRAVGGVTEPIQRAARSAGADAPFVTGKDANGERFWKASA